MDKTVQDLLTGDLLQVVEDDAGKNETVEVLEFMRDNSVPLTENQFIGLLMLQENGLTDVANLAFNGRRLVAPKRTYFDLISKLTLADRIRGNARLSHLLKANANPANGALSAKDLQPQAMSRKEIDRF